MEIIATIFPDAEAFLIENLPDFCVDGVSAVYPIEKWNWAGTRFIDDYEDTSKIIDLPKLAEALDTLVQQVSGKKLFVGGITNPVDLTDPCNWDVEVVDAFYQIAYYGEVIYG